MQILIDKGKSQGFIDTEANRYADWLKFMRGWTLEEITDYCRKHHWNYTIIETPKAEEIQYDYGC